MPNRVRSGGVSSPDRVVSVLGADDYSTDLCTESVGITGSAGHPHDLGEAPTRRQGAHAVIDGGDLADDAPNCLGSAFIRGGDADAEFERVSGHYLVPPCWLAWYDWYQV